MTEWSAAFSITAVLELALHAMAMSALPACGAGSRLPERAPMESVTGTNETAPFGVPGNATAPVLGPSRERVARERRRTGYV